MHACFGRRLGLNSWLFACLFVGRITVLETHNFGIFSSTTVLMNMNLWPIDTVEKFKKSKVMSPLQAHLFVFFASFARIAWSRPFLPGEAFESPCAPKVGILESWRIVPEYNFVKSARKVSRKGVNHRAHHNRNCLLMKRAWIELLIVDAQEFKTRFGGE